MSSLLKELQTSNQISETERLGKIKYHCIEEESKAIGGNERQMVVPRAASQERQPSRARTHEPTNKEHGFLWDGDVIGWEYACIQRASIRYKEWAKTVKNTPGTEYTSPSHGFDLSRATS
ncbi:uncharacterized protein PGTG_02357 [Puccinia graminis f. sp. tritici CRL 75-36-700-3]|uniref:Uncharacterized protein n=1 Tax=Puccinia graminis f. sp. tritici (strain CRL 75-36-700-3 / race SCCL) TaxID=418459 RepID=E3JXX1_PUCGT|nr:uncharacterized protein PGTG_02357 [Puccinia graminis f. sp. tritici CRL 75-36-700-3]EFP76896.1 hypothetical protein PGTG_02357 [Puccinia graminis f. sp. tritici CRL 75-36-700-3]